MLSSPVEVAAQSCHLVSCFFFWPDEASPPRTELWFQSGGGGESSSRGKLPNLVVRGPPEYQIRRAEIVFRRSPGTQSLGFCRLETWAAGKQQEEAKWYNCIIQ